MTVADLARMQLNSHRSAAFWDMPAHRVQQDELSTAQFFLASGKPIGVHDRHDLVAIVKSQGAVYMLSKLFGKPTVYTLK